MKPRIKRRPPINVDPTTDEYILKEHSPDLMHEKPPFFMKFTGFRLRMAMIKEQLKIIFGMLFSANTPFGSKYGIPDFFGFKQINQNVFENRTLKAQMFLVGLSQFGLSAPHDNRTPSRTDVKLDGGNEPLSVEPQLDKGWGLLLEIIHDGFKFVKVLPLPSVSEFKQDVAFMGNSMIPYRYAKRLSVPELLYYLGFKEYIPTSAHQQPDDSSFYYNQSRSPQLDYEDYRDVPMSENFDFKGGQTFLTYNREYGSLRSLSYALMKSTVEAWRRRRHRGENSKKKNLVEVHVDDIFTFVSDIKVTSMSEKDHLLNLFPTLEQKIPDNAPLPRIQTVFLERFPNNLSDLLNQVPIRVKSFGTREGLGQFVRLLVYSRNPLFNTDEDSKVLYSYDDDEVYKFFESKFEKASGEENVDKPVDTD